jgi:hypothetical protein
MRFIVKEQQYEKQIASGQFRYEVDGVPTGALETWRLNAAMDGYEVLRVDLDARQAESRHSYIYHLVRQANGRPERLAYRFWGSELIIEGTLLFEETNVTGTRTVNGRTFPEDVDIEPNTGFWFPSVVGLGLAANLLGIKDITAVTLNNQVGGEDTLALQVVTMDVYPLITDTMDLDVCGKSMTAVPYMIRWGDNKRIIVRDLNFWPVRMERPYLASDDLLTAVPIYYNRY